MKKAVSFILAAIFAASALVSCTTPGERVVEGADPYGSSSSDYADASWLKSRLGEIPDSVTVGTADSLGIDMTSFEDDGYIIRNNDGEVILCGKTADGLDRAVRRYAKCVKYGAPVENVTYHEGYRVERLTVAGRDISDFTVAYTRSRGEVKNPFLGFTKGNGEFAATEFVRLVEEATGVTLPMFDLSSGEAAPSPTVYFEADESPEADSPYGMTGYAYEVKDGDLYFRGSGISGGVANGVYYFFEHNCGWNNLTFGDAILDEAEHIDIPEGLSHKGTTMFDTYYPYGIFYDDFRYGHEMHCGAYTVACHGIQNNKFIDNVDLTWSQPCYSDPLNIENCVENIELYLDANPDAYYVDIAQPDNEDWCQCKTCREIFKEEGSQSGVVTRFCNEVSETVDADYPGIKFLMFAYLQTKQPPKVTRPNDLISVTFCFDGTCYNHAINSGLCQEQVWKTEALKSGITNATFAEWLEGWCAICDDMYAWYYTMDGGCMQYNTLDVLYEDMTYMHRLGIKCLFLETEYYGEGIGRLCSDMIGALQFEPDMTYDEYRAVLERKAGEYYGEDRVEEFGVVAEILRRSTAMNGCETCWCAESAGASDAMEYMGKNLEKANAALDEMIADAPSKEAELNCKRLSLMVLYEGVFGRYVYGDHTDLDRLNELYGTFADRAEECGMNLEYFMLGIAFAREIKPTLAGEIEYWKTVVFGLE